MPKIRENETLEQRTIRHEGFAFKPKYDAKGKYMIGYGHNIPPSAVSDWANGITVDEALDLLEADIIIARAGVKKRLPWADKLSPLRQEILIEMAFQMGIDGLIKFRKFLAAAQRGDWKVCAAEMKDSKWHNSDSPSRAKEMISLFLKG